MIRPHNGHVRPSFRTPLVIWVGGILCFVVGAVAATTHVSRHDLYVDVDGAVCNGGSILDACFQIDPVDFHPPPPDLSSYEPRGFGFVEPGRVPGGSLYYGRCEVQAIELNGVVSSRSDFRLWSVLANFSWGLPLGIALIILAGVLYLFRGDLSPRLKRIARAAVIGQVGVAALYVLVVYVSWANSLPVTTASGVVIAFVVFAMVALNGYLFAIGLTVQLAVARWPRDEVRIALAQTGGALVFLFGLIAVSFLNILTLWC